MLDGGRVQGEIIQASKAPRVTVLEVLRVQGVWQSAGALVFHQNRDFLRSRVSS